MTLFEEAFHLVIGEEGGYTKDPADPGNWTGGSCGRGVCNGTKYGVSAAAHPHLAIKDLTLAQAQQIYRQTYWDPIHADELPKQLSLLLFDAAVNCGIDRAIAWLQTAVGCAADGLLGPETLSAVKASSEGISDLGAEFQTQRLVWMCSLPTWHTFGLGWARRLCRLPYLSVTFGDSSSSSAA